MLEIKNLVAGYGKVRVLQAISISVPKGQLVTLIGTVIETSCKTRTLP